MFRTIKNGIVYQSYVISYNTLLFDIKLFDSNSVFNFTALIEMKAKYGRTNLITYTYTKAGFIN